MTLVNVLPPYLANPTFPLSFSFFFSNSKFQQEVDTIGKYQDNIMITLFLLFYQTLLIHPKLW